MTCQLTIGSAKGLFCVASCPRHWKHAFMHSVHLHGKNPFLFTVIQHKHVFRALCSGVFKNTLVQVQTHHGPREMNNTARPSFMFFHQVVCVVTCGIFTMAILFFPKSTVTQGKKARTSVLFRKIILNLKHFFSRKYERGEEAGLRGFPSVVHV